MKVLAVLAWIAAGLLALGALSALGLTLMGEYESEEGSAVVNGLLTAALRGGLGALAYWGGREAWKRAVAD